jgi:hypothetical protein
MAPVSRFMPIPLGPSSNPARSSNVSTALLVNCFVEASETGKNSFAIYADPGLVTRETFTDAGSIRGGLLLGNLLYVVAGETLYSVTSDGTQTEIGDVLGTQAVIFARNAAATPQVVIVADSILYLLVGGVLSVFPDADLPDLVVSASFIDNYIVFLLSDGRFFWSAVNDADDIDALDFKTAEGRPDGGVRNITLGREMWVFGDESIEVYATSNDATDPFPRIGGGFISRGCKSKHSVCTADNTVVWASDNGMVMRASGFTPVRISNSAVERDLQRTIDAQRATRIEAFVWNEGGHEFYQISGLDWTWVYDFSTSLWHKKDSVGSTRSRIRHYFRAFDLHIVGDNDSAKLYRMSIDLYDEAGDALIMTIRTPIFDEQGHYITWDALLLDMEMGVGDAGADEDSAEINPTVMLNWSDDGGKTWGFERERPLGRQSKFKGRLQFNQLGTSREQGRAYQIRISAACKKVVIQAHARIRVHRAQAA